MKTILLILIIYLSSAFGAYARPVIIVNLENDIDTLDKKDLIALFMGRTNTFPDGNRAVVFDQGSSSIIKKEFYYTLTNRSIFQINSHWARLLFTGRAIPPIELEDNSKIMKEVHNNLYAIAYIDSDNVDNSVKVIFSFH